MLPLREDCGLIEWVPDTVAVRHVLMELQTRLNVGYTFADVRQMHQQVRLLLSPLLDCTAPWSDLDCWVVLQGAEIKDEAKLAKFELELFRKLLIMFPPIFHHWSLWRFPEPTQWFENRLVYARSVATWSMVGYLVGLGDRHAENILLDEKNGECVHVDYDCLFDKGATLEKPERVPFRLTSNIVDGFGVTGVNGTFRRSCEVALSVMRQNYETLMSVLESFIHDPLVEWKDKAATQRQILSTIEIRLKGVVSKETLPLSVQGQVHQLIATATSEQNLSRMYASASIVTAVAVDSRSLLCAVQRRYIGWMPWL